MPSSFTGNKYLELPANGAYPDTWNVPVNADMSVIDTAFGGNVSLNATAGSATLTTAQYQPLIIFVTGAMSANVVYTIPSGIGGQWIIENTTTDATGGPWNVVFTCAGSAYPLIIPRNATTNIFCDGTNVQFADSRTPFAAGSNQQVQYNSNGILGASPNFVFDGTNVGIGTSTPVGIGNLSVLGALASSTTRIVAGNYDYWSGPSYTATLLQQDGTSVAGTLFGLSRAGLGCLVFQNGTAGLVGTNGSAPLVFGQASVERARIATSGNFGIGTASPNVKLEVSSGSAATTNTDGQIRASSDVASLDLVAYGSTATTYGMWNASEVGAFSTKPINIMTTGATAPIKFAAGGNAEQMRISSAGDVGIGTASPGSKLEASSGSTTTNTTGQIRASSDVASLDLVAYGSTATTYGMWNASEVGAFSTKPINIMTTGATAPIKFAAGGNTEKMRLTAAGDVGIGTASPGVKLEASSGSTTTNTTGQIRASADVASLDLVAYGSTATAYGMWNASEVGAFSTKPINIMTTGGTAPIKFAAGGNTEKMRIDSSGNVGIGTASPGSKLEASSGSTTTNTVGQIRASSDVASLDLVAYGSTATTYGMWNASEVGAFSTKPINIMTTGATAPIKFAAGGNAEQMRISSAGNVGIGTASPGSKLEASSGSTTTNTTGQIRASSDVASLDLVAYGSTATPYGTWGVSEVGIFSIRPINIMTTGATAPIKFSTGAGVTEQMRIDSDGNLLVGTTASAGAKLQVYMSGTTAVLVQSGLNCYETGNISGTGTYNGIVFSNNGSSSFVASVQVLASSVVYNTSSDARLKLNVQDAAPVLDLVNSVQVRCFDWKNTGEHQRYGMVAQELQVVAPEFVNDQLDDDHTLGIDYSKLVPMLTKAIQELSAKNDALEARLAKLETV